MFEIKKEPYIPNVYAASLIIKKLEPTTVIAIERSRVKKNENTHTQRETKQSSIKITVKCQQERRKCTRTVLNGTMERTAIHPAMHACVCCFFYVLLNSAVIRTVQKDKCKPEYLHNINWMCTFKERMKASHPYAVKPFFKMGWCRSGPWTKRIQSTAIKIAQIRSDLWALTWIPQHCINVCNYYAIM